MSLIIEKEIFEWLIKIEVLKSNQFSQQVPSGKIALDENTSREFMCGTLVAKILSKLAAFFPKRFEKPLANQIGLNTLKSATSPSSKLQNWNTLCEALKKLGIVIDHDTKSLIVAGDFELVHSVLKELFDLAQGKELTIFTMKTDRSKKSGELSLSALKKTPTLNTSISYSSPQLIGSKYREKDINEVVDLNKINTEKELSQAESLLAFFLCSVARSMSFTPRQTVQVLSNNHKYLAHIVAKGIKDVFEPIIRWFKTLISNVRHLATLIGKEQDRKHTIEFVHHAMKIGLVSKDFEVAHYACKFFQKLAYEYFSQDLLSYSWDWFVADQGGLQYCLLCIKRHPEIAENAISVIIEFARYSVMELFTHHLKRFHSETKEFIQTIRTLLKPLSESPLTKDEIITAGIMDVWLDAALTVLDDELGSNPDLKILALGFLCDVWTIYPQKIEEQETNANKVISTLKKMTRDQPKNLSISAVTQLFRLFEHFSEKKNAYAPVLYKTLTFILFENYNNFNFRNLMLLNFRQILSSIDSVPIGVIIEPLVKQLQQDENTNYNINVPDIEFLETLAKHPRLGLKHSIQLLDIFAKIYLNNIVFAPIAGKCMMHLFTAFIGSEPLQEYVVKFVKISLAIFFTSEKSKRPKEKILPRYNNKHVSSKPVVSNQELEQEILNSQRRALIIEAAKNVIGLESPWVNKKIRMLILFTHHQLKIVTKAENKGILALISLYGQTNDVIAQFEEDLEREASTTSPSRGSAGEDLDDINFFKELGIVKKKKKIDKSQAYDLAHLKKITADPKVVANLLQIKEKLSDKALKEQEKEAMEKEKQETLARKIEYEVDKMRIEFGLPSTKDLNVAEHLTFEEGSRAAAKIYEKIKNPNKINLVILEHEEDRDREGVNAVLHKYAKALKHLFVTYSYTVNGGSAPLRSFSSLEQRRQFISLAELWKMIKNHEVQSLITLEECRELIKLINTQIFKKIDLKELDYNGFQQFFVQMAVLIYSRPPKVLSDLPIFCSLQELIKHFRDTTARKGKLTLIYDDPEASETIDKELARFLNNALVRDPKYPLPESFKKVYEKDLDFNYTLPKSLGISNSFRFAYEILDEMVQKVVGTKLLEPSTVFTTLPKAKSKLIAIQLNQVSPKLKTEEPFVHKSLDDILAIKTNRSPLPKLNYPTSVRSPMLRIDQKQLSITLKKELLKFPTGQFAQGVEVAEVLEDVLRKVERKALGLPPNNLQIINRAIEEKMWMKENEKKEKKERERKLTERSKQVKHDLEEIQREGGVIRGSNVKRNKAEPDPEKEAIRLRHLEKIKEEVRYRQMIREQDELATKAEDRRRAHEEREEKKQKFKEWHEQKLERIKDTNQKIKEQRDEEKRNFEEKLEKNKEKETEYKQKRFEKLKEEKKKFEQKKLVEDKIKRLVEKKEISDFFKSRERELKQVYQWYVNTVHHVVGVRHNQDELVYKSFMNFAADFVIHPALLTLREVQSIFRVITNRKPLEDGTQVTMSLKEFEEALLRIAIKAGSVCNQLYVHKTSNDGEKGDEEYEDIMKQYLARREEEDEQGENADADEEGYEKIDQATLHTVEGLFFYLGIPKDKQAVFDKLNALHNSVIPYREKMKNVQKRMAEMDNEAALEAERQNQQNQEEHEGEEKPQQEEEEPQQEEEAQQEEEGQEGYDYDDES